MSIPFPIYSTQKELKAFMSNLSDRTRKGGEKIVSLSVVYDEHEFMKADFLIGASYLTLWGTAQNQTYNAYRNDVEKLMLWCWLERGISILSLTKSDYAAFLDFCGNPPKEWIMLHRYSKYTGKSLAEYNDLDPEMKVYYESRSLNYNGGLINPLWRPFLAAGNSETKYITRSPSEQTMTRQRRVLSSFYNHLTEEELIDFNPVSIINRKRSGVIDESIGKSTVKRLSSETWRKMLLALGEKALDTPDFERTLFVIVLMKGCFLRISEISSVVTENGIRVPKMSDIELLSSHGEGNSGSQESFWYIKVHGKGNKVRSVSIPDSLIPYIERYREHRGLGKGMPTKLSTEPLIHNLRSVKGVTSKQASRIVKKGFDYFCSLMKEQGEMKIAAEAEQASTHWLRHTGASMSAETIGIINLSKEMGHTDPSLTARMYLHTDEHERAISGKKRGV
jgi:integrase